jgi:hypothetical protein
MQLVGKGAQDTLVTGNPSFTHFRSVYKRHTEFAMEHFRLYFKTTNLNLPPSGSLTLTAKVERYAQLLHDCYLSITLPDIYSPIVSTYTQPNGATAIGYNFQWIQNIGYNLINYVSVTVNGQEIVRHTGEWMKIYANLKFDANKKAILEELIGNVADIYDPANAFDRLNQYPHSVSTSAGQGAPSIRGRTLTIPLHFWFCESIGSALPLVALQYSEVQIVVDLKNIYQLFTVNDVRQLILGQPNPAFGTRIVSDGSSAFNISNFLSPPLYPSQSPSLPNVSTWKMDPFLECNYLFVSDAEMAHIASTDHSFLLTQLDVVQQDGQYGPSNDIELGLRNLCTRVVWVCQRSDRYLQNDFDNYTNWTNPYLPPLSGSSTQIIAPTWGTSGALQQSGITARDILLESAIILDGAERFNYKQTEFFSHIQNYRHQTGRTIKDILGIYSYSFALDHDKGQPSGHINGSQFNKTILRNTYVQPPLASLLGVVSLPAEVCILKSTAGNANPTLVPRRLVGTTNAPYTPDEVIRIVQKTSANTLAYTYTVRVFIESYNFFRVMGGVANVVFSS